MKESPSQASSAELTRLRARVNAYATTLIQKKFEDSQLQDESIHLPQFSMDEVVQGKYLGKGFFGIVYEVKGLDGRDCKGKLVRLQPKKPWFQRQNSSPEGEAEKRPSLPSENDEDGDDDDSEHPPPDAKVLARKQEAARDFMRRHCQRDNGQARYAVKSLRPEILQDPTKLYFQGIMDLATETRLLSSCQHPHIVKLRGIAQGRCNEEYFLILDRLYEVLEVRTKVWRRRLQRISGLLGRNILDRNGRKRVQLWQERMVAAHDLASALGYLHSRRIIHRDLKTDNIGFDIRGDIKIFDFGLARELPPVEHANMQGTWKMTGCTGTPRYMSPEVALNKPYNESSDSYSFSMLFWEMLALKTPFELYSMKGFQSRVWKAPHKRPPLDPSWPQSLHLVLYRCWSPELGERQPMMAVAEILRKEVIKCRDDSDDGWGLNMGAERRSTHVFDEKDFRMDLSQKSLFSIISSPFHSKASFPTKSSISAESTKSPTKVTKTEREILDVTKATVEMSLSPSHVDLSEQSNEDDISPRRVLSLPTKPPLLDEDEECESHHETKDVHIDETEMTESRPSQIRSFSHSSIWDRINEERERQEHLRMRLTAFR